MESRHYLLPTDTHTRLELVCGNHWRYVHIEVDGTQIGSVSSASHLLNGAEFFLPDGGRLGVRLVKQVGASDLHVTLNGRILHRTGLDRANRDVQTGYQAVLAIGAVNLIFFFLTLMAQPSSTTVRWYDFAFGVAFLFLGWMVREGSGKALTLALVIYLADTAITLITILSYRYYIGIVDLSINFVLLFFMLQGYGGLQKTLVNFRWLGRMLRDVPAYKPTTSALSKTDDERLLPDDFKRVPVLLRKAIQLYADGQQRERARAMVKQALKIAPSLADGWYVLASMVEHADDRLRALERVVSLNPFHAGAQEALDKFRRGRDFVDDFMKAELPTQTDRPASLLAQAADDLKRGDKQAAADVIRQALHIDPQNADAWFLASYLSQVPEERRAVLEQAMKCNPTHAVAQQALTRVNETETMFSELKAAEWRPDLTDVLLEAKRNGQLSASPSKAQLEQVAIRAMVGLLIVIGGLIFVIVILSP